jgi:hypothetical protein
MTVISNSPGWICDDQTWLISRWLLSECVYIVDLPPISSWLRMQEKRKSRNLACECINVIPMEMNRKVAMPVLVSPIGGL